MPTFKELAKFPDTPNGPVMTWRPVTLENCLKVIEQEPGVTTREVARTLNPQADNTLATRVAGVLGSHVKTRHPKIRRIQQDSFYRYYPINYRLSGDSRITQAAPAKPAALIDEVIQVINESPGITTKEIAHALNPEADRKFFTAVSNALYQHFLGKSPKVSRQRDGENTQWRYYPLDYDPNAPKPARQSFDEVVEDNAKSASEPKEEPKPALTPPQATEPREVITDIRHEVTIRLAGVEITIKPIGENR